MFQIQGKSILFNLKIVTPKPILACTTEFFIYFKNNKKQRQGVLYDVTFISLTINYDDSRYTHS